MGQPRCSRSLQISLNSKWAPGPCDTCTVPRLCTSSAASLCSPVGAGPPCSAPSLGQHWRTDHAAHLEENDKIQTRSHANEWHPFTVVLFHNYHFMTYSATKVYSSNSIFKSKRAFTLCEKVDARSISSNIEMFRQAPAWLRKEQAIRFLLYLRLLPYQLHRLFHGR